MLWLQKTPNGNAGFRHTWRVKWSPSPGRIGQMVAVRLITIACKMEASLLSSLTKRLSFPAMPSLHPYSFIDWSTVCLQPFRWKQKYSVIWNLNRMCAVEANENATLWFETSRWFEPPSRARIPYPNEVEGSSRVSWRLSWSLFAQPLAIFKWVTSLMCNCSLPSRLLSLSLLATLIE